MELRLCCIQFPQPGMMQTRPLHSKLAEQVVSQEGAARWHLQQRQGGHHCWELQDAPNTMFQFGQHQVLQRAGKRQDTCCAVVQMLDAQNLQRSYGDVITDAGVQQRLWGLLRPLLPTPQSSCQRFLLFMINFTFADRSL